MKTAPWRRYGKDRTYLAEDDGTAIGWIDNLTGEVRCESDEARAAIEAWLAQRIPEGAEPVPPVAFALDSPGAELAPDKAAGGQSPDLTFTAVGPETVLDASEAVQLAPAQDWEDLALRRSGQGVRELARNELAANWEESKFRTVMRVIVDAHTDERAWRVGAGGEETIGSKLEKLAAHGWRVLHSVPIGEHGSDIDHIVIGPGGVWTINSKNHPGKKIWVAPRQIRVDGHIVPYLRNSTFEANRVRRILEAQLGWEPYVRAALVFMTGSLVPDVTCKGRPEDVDIWDRLDINRQLKREPVRLSADQVAEIFEVARRSTTWVR